MTDRLTPQDLKDADLLLTDLLEVVSRQESTLSDRSQQGPGSKALQSLLDTKVEFGNPQSNLIRLNRKLIEEMKIKLTVPQVEQIDKNKYKFYYTIIPVSIRIEHEAVFTQLVCDLDFGPKGKDEPIAQNIFPPSHLKEMLSAGASVNIAVKGEVETKADFSIPLSSPFELQLDAQGKARVNAFVATQHFKFTLGKADIQARGEDSSHCDWNIKGFNLQKSQTAQFCIIFKVPLHLDKVELAGVVAFAPSMGWLIDSIRNVFEHLSKKHQALLRREEKSKGNTRLKRGDSKNWTLDLPD